MVNNYFAIFYSTQPKYVTEHIFRRILVIFVLEFVFVSIIVAQDNEIDQQTRRRIMKTGVTAYDSTLAYPGYILFSPSFFDNTSVED